MSTTRLALAGAGWSGRVHLLASATLRDAKLTAVATQSVGTAEELAAAVAATPMSSDRLPAGTDAVIVATPTATHSELAIRMIAAGTPVLIEQPIAVTLAEADAIIDAATSAGVAACYAENLLFSPALDLAVARRATLGQLTHLEVRLHQPEPDWGHFADPLAAGGVLLHLGAHAVAVAMVLAGDDPIEAVRCRLGSSRTDGADDVARVELRFASRFIATIDVSWGGTEIHWSTQAASETGVVRVEFQPNCAVEVNGDELELPPLPQDADPRVYELGYREQLRGFTSVISGQGGRVCPAGFGRTVLDVICAAYDSAGREAEESAVPFTGPRDLTPMQLWRRDPTPGG